MKSVNFSVKFVIFLSSLMAFFCAYLYIDFIQLKSPVGDVFFGHLVEGENVGIGVQKVFSSLMTIMAGVSISWSLFFIVLSFRLLKQKQEWIIDLMLASIIIWYVSDTFASYHFGIIINVVLNSVFFLLVFVPLLIIKKAIKKVGLVTQ